MRLLSATALIALLAAPALAETPSQILKLIRNGLAMEGIETDVTKLTGDQVSALHLELSAPNDEEDIRRQDVLIAILNRNPETAVAR